MEQSKRFAALLFAVFVNACGGGGDGGGGGASCSPSPQITSSPPTQAMAGVQYAYFVSASYACIPFITPCGQVDGIQLPPGAGIDPIRGVVFWTPSASQSNTTVPFQIATKPDLCGNRTTQSWTVTVS